MTDKPKSPVEEFALAYAHENAGDEFNTCVNAGMAMAKWLAAELMKHPRKLVYEGQGHSSEWISVELLKRLMGEE